MSPVAVKSHALTVAVPRSVLSSALPKRAEVTGRGAAEAHSPPCISVATRINPVKASDAEIAVYAAVMPLGHFANAATGTSAGRVTPASVSFPHMPAIFSVPPPVKPPAAEKMLQNGTIGLGV